MSGYCCSNIIGIACPEEAVGVHTIFPVELLLWSPSRAQFLARLRAVSWTIRMQSTDLCVDIAEYSIESEFGAKFGAQSRVGGEERCVGDSSQDFWLRESQHGAYCSELS